MRKNSIHLFKVLRKAYDQQTLFDCEIDESAFEVIQKEQKGVGYYTLPEQNLEYLKDYKESFEAINSNIKHLVIIGIGGSSLGLKAIYRTLKNIYKFSRRIHFLESTDPTAIQSEFEKIELEKTHFFVISKSGITVETMAIYKYVLELLAQNNLEDNFRFTYITDKGSALEAHSKTKNSFCLYVKENVGGRFSVLSAVGLAPLSLIEVDIKALLNGAKSIKNSFFEDGYLKNTLLKKQHIMQKILLIIISIHFLFTQRV